ncbi:hypothetical protein G9A89_021668 [Geosiphon pyriformis]|nr:hypothetical protein G9A89_021668 [Geosiphon pyriformis]
MDSLGSNHARKAADVSLQTRKRIAQSILREVFGQHVADLVWFHLDQGPNPRGCFGSTPVDPMHAFEEGIVPNILSVILDPLPDSLKSNLDALALSIVAANRWDKDYPRMNFSGGFSSLTLLTADKKVGKMLLLWIIMHTKLGKDILSKRCSPTFDLQRTTAAARFNGGISSNLDGALDETEEEDESTNVGNSLKYIGSPLQVQVVDSWLREYRLEFVIPWIREMTPYHQEGLRKTVYQIYSLKGKTAKHVLPDQPFLDRRNLSKSTSTLYCAEVAPTQGTQKSQKVQYKDGKSAEFSLDCSVEELQELLQMLLAFHANYKYGTKNDETNFDESVRQMMSMIKGMIRRGNDTKNWSISKFHELLHFHVDQLNFGSLSNVDAGKGEHGLKLWAKLPSKNVRARDANLYYTDLAQRIYENRLLELASETLLPLVSPSASTRSPAQRQDGEVDLNIQLSLQLLTLTQCGETILQEDLAIFLRRQTTINFPLEVYQEAKYSRAGQQLRTIRASPKYRSTGAWYDWVLVCYQIGTDEVLYPYQVFGFFVNKKGQKTAVGRMGQRMKSQNSCLLDHWSMESQFRLVDMETIWQVVFAVSLGGGHNISDGRGSNEVLVLKDRVQDWPTLFVTHKWFNTARQANKKKRKHQNEHMASV